MSIDKKAEEHRYDGKEAEKEMGFPKVKLTADDAIPYADNIPPALISDDSKSGIEEREHHGSDNSPNSSWARNNQ